MSSINNWHPSLPAVQVGGVTSGCGASRLTPQPVRTTTYRLMYSRQSTVWEAAPSKRSAIPVPSSLLRTGLHDDALALFLPARFTFSFRAGDSVPLAVTGPCSRRPALSHPSARPPRGLSPTLCCSPSLVTAAAAAAGGCSAALVVAATSAWPTLPAETVALGAGAFELLPSRDLLGVETPLTPPLSLAKCAFSMPLLLLLLVLLLLLCLLLLLLLLWLP